MTPPITGNAQLITAVVLGAIFGALLHRGRVTEYDVIVGFFRLKDPTVLRVMLTAILVGGIGVWVLHGQGLANWHIKPAQLAAVSLGSLIFGVGMVLYGYCPGTGVAAIGAGRVDALIGAFGMLLGGMLFAWTYPWLQVHVLPLGDLGKQRLPDVTGIPDVAWYLLIAAGWLATVVATRRRIFGSVTEGNRVDK